MKIQGIILTQLDQPTYISIPTRESAEQLEDFLFSKGVYWHNGRSEEDTTPRAVLDRWFCPSNLVMSLIPENDKIELYGTGPIPGRTTLSLKQFMELQTNIRRR